MPNGTLSNEVLARLDSGLQNLNPLQLAAVRECSELRADNSGNVVTVVDGPPGAGKTTVCAYASLEYLRLRTDDPQANHVVVLSYTNTSSDRCLESLQELGTGPDSALRLVPRGYRPPHEADARFYMAYEREGDLTLAERRRLRSAKILLCTTYAAARALRLTRSPLVIFDEISQISTGTFLGILGSAKGGGRDLDRIALVGDPAQLPVVTSQSLLETNAASFLLAEVRNLRPHQLLLQYRMHSSICAVVNTARRVLGAFPLETAGLAQNRTLENGFGAPNVADRSTWAFPLLEPNCPVVAVNTDALPGAEQRVGQSWFYEEEASAAVGIGRLLKAAYAELNPVLLSPYRVQKETMEELSGEELDCLSIHESQGREYDCVILSLTRKHAERNVGFLGDMLPLSYVGLSRARCKLVILLSFSTFAGSSFPQPIVEFLLSDAAVSRIDASTQMMDWMP